MTYTYVEMEVSQPTYDEVKAKLHAAGYDHAISESGALDMHGLALVLEPAHEVREVVTADATSATAIHTGFGTGLSIAIVAPPAILELGRDGGAMLVKIAHNGTIEYGEGYAPDEAARTFWEAMAWWCPVIQPIAGRGPLTDEEIEQCVLRVVQREDRGGGTLKHYEVALVREVERAHGIGVIETSAEAQPQRNGGQS